MYKAATFVTFLSFLLLYAPTKASEFLFHKKHVEHCEAAVSYLKTRRDELDKKLKPQELVLLDFMGTLEGRKKGTSDEVARLACYYKNMTFDVAMSKLTFNKPLLDVQQ